MSHLRRTGKCSGPASMKKSLSRLEQDESRNFPGIHSASSAVAERHECYAVAPIHTDGIAMRHAGPRDAT